MSVAQKYEAMYQLSKEQRTKEEPASIGASLPKVSWGEEGESVPRERVPMDYSSTVFDSGSEVVVILPALMEFVKAFESELEAAKPLGMETTLDLAQSFTTDGILMAVVLNKEKLPCPSSSSSAGFVSSVFRVTVQLEGSDGTATGEPVTIPWLPADHPLVTTDAHIISRAAYEESTLEMNIKPGAQITRLFPCADDPSKAEVYEGRVYWVGKPPGDVGTDFPDTPFQCLHVVW
jgi:hypothetical protein